jgi:hypothetical protein
MQGFFVGGCPRPRGLQLDFVPISSRNRRATRQECRSRQCGEACFGRRFWWTEPRVVRSPGGATFGLTECRAAGKQERDPAPADQHRWQAVPRAVVSGLRTRRSRSIGDR